MVIMADNVEMNFLNKIKGYGILIEAGFLSFINYTLFGDHKSIIDLIPRQDSATEIIAILTVLLLSLGFIYYIGYHIAARFTNPDKMIIGGETLRDNILPYGAIFILVIFLTPLIIYLSSSQLSEIRLFVMINFGFVFFVGFINDYIVIKFKLRNNLNDTSPLDKQINEIQERLNKTETRLSLLEENECNKVK